MNTALYKVISKRVPRKIDSKVRREGDYYVALSPIMGAFISMNNLAGKIYIMIDGRTCIGDIVQKVEAMNSKFEENKIKEDVCKCISDLESFNLITVIK